MSLDNHLHIALLYSTSDVKIFAHLTFTQNMTKKKEYKGIIYKYGMLIWNNRDDHIAIQKKKKEEEKVCNLS